jgi:high affinity sulfate transporter 1
MSEYRRSWLRNDVIAGFTIWAMLVPLAMACAVLVGVEPIVGLYTLPLALLCYAIFGGSRLLVVGPDKAVAVLSGSIIASFAVSGSELLAFAVVLALIAGIIYVLFFLLKMGWIADLIPEPVLKGFVEGIVWLTLLKQLNGLLGLGLDAAPKEFHWLVIAVVKALPSAHFATAFMGLTCVVTLLVLRRFAPRIPGSIIVLLGSIVIVVLLGLGEKGVAVLGEVSGGFPDLSLPFSVGPDRIVVLIPGALAIVILGYTMSLAALKQAAQHNGDIIDPNRELLAIGASSIGAGLSGGYAPAGSLTATTVGIDSGGKSQLANLFAGVLCVLTILFLLPLLADLALNSLAAIIVVALIGLSDLGYFRRLWTVRRVEFLVGIAAFVGVLTFGVMPGVMIGTVLALFKLAQAIHSPTTAIVGRTSTGAFVDVDEHPDAREIPGILIWRQYGPLVFLNARVLANELRSVVKARGDVKVVVFDATAAAGIDTSAADAMLAARNDLLADGIQLWVANPRQKGWDLVVASLAAEGAAIPPRFESLADAVAEFEKSNDAAERQRD